MSISVKLSLIIVVLGFNIAVSAKLNPYLPIYGESECEYSGRNYDVRYPEMYEWKKLRHHEIYEMGDRVGSSYETDEVWTKIVKDIVEKIGESLFHTEDNPILLRAQYEFPNSDDFALLKYRIGRWTVFIGLKKSTEELFYFTDNFGYSILENYNEMISEHPDVLNLSPGCLAKLLAKFKYPEHEIIYLDSSSDLIVGTYVIGIMFTGVPLAYYLQNAQELYFDRPSDSDKLNEIFSAMAARPSITQIIRDKIDGIIEEFKTEHQIVYSQDIINTHNGSCKVRLTIYEPYTGEVSRWEIAFNRDNAITSFERIDGPYKAMECRYFFIAEPK